MHQARFVRLLIALSLLLFTAPFVGAFENQLGRTLAAVLLVGVLATVLIAASLTVSEKEHQSRFAILLSLACIILSAPAHLVDSAQLRILHEILTIILLIHVIHLIIRSLFRARRVDYDTIAASLCGYLLTGIVFAAGYALLVEFNSAAINTGTSAEFPDRNMRFGDETTATTLYFSFVTLTTLGFGDITPVSMPARMLTTAEALIGQLYLVVIVARLVGLHITNDMAERHDREG